MELWSAEMNYIKISIPFMMIFISYCGFCSGTNVSIIDQAKKACEDAIKKAPDRRYKLIKGSFSWIKEKTKNKCKLKAIEQEKEAEKSTEDTEKLKKYQACYVLATIAYDGMSRDMKVLKEVKECGHYDKSAIDSIEIKSIDETNKRYSVTISRSPHVSKWKLLPKKISKLVSEEKKIEDVIIFLPQLPEFFYPNDTSKPRSDSNASTASVSSDSTHGEPLSNCQIERNGGHEISCLSTKTDKQIFLNSINNHESKLKPVTTNIEKPLSPLAESLQKIRKRLQPDEGVEDIKDNLLEDSQSHQNTTAAEEKSKNYQNKQDPKKLVITDKELSAGLANLRKGATTKDQAKQHEQTQSPTITSFIKKAQENEALKNPKKIEENAVKEEEWDE